MYGKSRCNHRNMLIEDEITFLKNDDLKEYFELYLKVKFPNDISTERIQQLNEQVEKINRKLDILLDDYEEGLMIKDKYKERTRVLNDDLTRTEEEIRGIEQYDLDMENEKAKYELFLKYIKEIYIDNLSNTILKKIFRQIKVKEINLPKSLGTFHKYIYYLIL